MDIQQIQSTIGKRVIKFRAWDKVKGKMIQNDALQNRICNIYRVMNNPASNWEFMQFTGLLDKNGKEIYEGDILRYRNNSLYDRKVKVGVVVWNEQEAMWRAKSAKEKVNENDTDYTLDHITYRYLYSGEIQVIGNIFENPDLLSSFPAYALV